jgi:hypothetical protein
VTGHIDPLASAERLRQAYANKNAKTEKQKEVRVFEYQLTDSPSVLIYFAPGVDLEEAEKSLRDKFGERLISVRAR